MPTDHDYSSLDATATLQLLRAQHQDTEPSKILFNFTRLLGAYLNILHRTFVYMLQPVQ